MCLWCNLDFKGWSDFNHGYSSTIINYHQVTGYVVARKVLLSTGYWLRGWQGKYLHGCHNSEFSCLLFFPYLTCTLSTGYWLRGWQGRYFQVVPDGYLGRKDGSLPGAESLYRQKRKTRLRDRLCQGFVEKKSCQVSF